MQRDYLGWSFVRKVLGRCPDVGMFRSGPESSESLDPDEHLTEEEILQLPTVGLSAQRIDSMRLASPLKDPKTSKDLSIRFNQTTPSKTVTFIYVWLVKLCLCNTWSLSTWIDITFDSVGNAPNHGR